MPLPGQASALRPAPRLTVVATATRPPVALNAPPRPRLSSLARRALGLRGFLSEPVVPQQSRDDLQARLAMRNHLFLDSVRLLVFGHEASPYRVLLEHAGCSYADVEAGVREHGVEHTLSQLHAAGVYVSADEWKGRGPIVRPGLELHVTSADFDNPAVAGAAIEGSTSGSSGNRPVRTPYGWDALTEAASGMAVLLDAYGLVGAPSALWFPPPPAASGIQCTLLFAKLGRPPERWFSQTKPGGSVTDRAALRVLLTAARAAGVRLAHPEHVELGQAEIVARWLAAGPAPRMLTAFASSAVRVAVVARELGIDISGRTVGVGGEPVTPERRAVLEAAGVQVLAGYGSGEAGMIASGCPAHPAGDVYHVHQERVALIPTEEREDGPVPLLVTSLTPTAGKVLLNVDIGDEGVLSRDRCGCSIEGLGLGLRVSAVQSRSKQTSEGMTVSLRELWRIAGERLAPLGATRDDYQVWESHDADGLSRLRIVVNPRIEVDADAVVADVLEGLGRIDHGARLAAEVWRQAGTLKVVSGTPRLSAGAKLVPVLKVEPGDEPA